MHQDIVNYLRKVLHYCMVILHSENIRLVFCNEWFMYFAFHMGESFKCNLLTCILLFSWNFLG